MNTNPAIVGPRSAGGINWLKYASPQQFYPIAGKLIPWFCTAALVLSIVGAYVGFFIAPTDAQQGDA